MLRNFGVCWCRSAGDTGTSDRFSGCNTNTDANTDDLGQHVRGSYFTGRYCAFVLPAMSLLGVVLNGYYAQRRQNTRSEQAR